MSKMPTVSRKATKFQSLNHVCNSMAVSSSTAFALPLPDEGD